jgi:N-acetylneuraminate synthase
MAKHAGAHVAKFQKRNNRELLTEEQYNAPHPNPGNSFGNTYGEHREFLEVSLELNLCLGCHISQRIDPN